jgi:hypothetical protein
MKLTTVSCIASVPMCSDLSSKSGFPDSRQYFSHFLTALCRIRCKKPSYHFAEFRAHCRKESCTFCMGVYEITHTRVPRRRTDGLVKCCVLRHGVRYLLWRSLSSSPLVARESRSNVAYRSAIRNAISDCFLATVSYGRCLLPAPTFLPSLLFYDSCIRRTETSLTLQQFVRVEVLVVVAR